MRNRIIYALLLMFALNLSSAVYAQHNPYKIDDRLYPYFLRCNRALKEPRILAMADTLFEKATAIGDVKTECIALSLKPLYYYTAGNLPAMKSSIEQNRKFYLKTPYIQYVFSDWSRLIVHYIHDGNHAEATKELEAFQQEAFRLHNNFGIIQSYRHYGDLYSDLINYEEAVIQYRKAVDYSIASNEKNILSDLYLRIGASYQITNQQDSAVYYLREALDLAPEESRKIPIYTRLALIYVDTKQPEKADKDILRLQELRRSYPINNDGYHSLLAAYYREKGMYDTAHAHTDSIANTQLSAYESFRVYLAQKNFEQALYAFQEYNDLQVKGRSEVSNKRIAEMASRLDNQRLESEKEHLAMQNSQMRVLQLENEQHLLNALREKDTLALTAARLELDNKELTLQQQTQESELNRMEAARQKERAESAVRQNRMKNGIVATLSLLLFSLIVYAVLYVRHKHAAIAIIRQERNNALREKQLAEQAQQRAENADRMKTLFLQNMSHEIRTPLNAIVGFTELLNSSEPDDFSPEERDDMVSRVKTNTTLLMTLIGDILDLSKLESRTYTLRLSPVSVSQLCHTAADSVRIRVPEGVQLLVDEAPDSAEAVIYTDAARLQQVLTNFLTNACKYTEQGSITLSYRFDGTAWEFAVTDTGSGIPADKAEVVFQRFEKLDSFKQGTGLGLNICRLIADLVGGRVFVDTSYTAGARFVFIHPVLKPEAESESRTV